ncbi:MAG: LytTR family transcriptional regulator [Chryseobacterium sp.]|nr:MAG: LytTR family transcriptional regulator [Chryseobacterium sp.]
MKMKFYVNTEHLFNTIDYPNRFRSENIIKSSTIVFFSILVFLLLFKPFGVYDPELRMHYLFICFFHAFASSLITYVYFSCVNYFNKDKSQPQWSILKEYFNIVIVLAIIGSVSFLMRDLLYNNPDNWSWRYLFEEVRNCFVAGIFFYFFLRLSGFYFESKKGSPSLIHFEPLGLKSEKIMPQRNIFISTQVKQDHFNLDIDHLLFAKADGNYIELIISENNLISTDVKRISLTQFEAQIAEHPNFFRCHRAYLVNMFKVEKISGNSQGYLLSFGGTNLQVPVSRKQTEMFNTLYQALRNKHSD